MASIEQQTYPNRRFVIFDCTELPLVDFSQVYETSADTVRKSVDETETFVKYDQVIVTDDSGSIISTMPSSIEALTTKSQEYTYDEILVILAGPEWTDPDPQV